MRTLGEQARDFRLGKGWKPTQMAREVSKYKPEDAEDVSRQNIESLEKHGNRLTKYIGALARLMGRTVDDMLCEAGLATPLPRVDPWPFSRVSFERFEKLADEDKAYVEGRLEAAVERCENPPPPTPPAQTADSAEAIVAAGLGLAGERSATTSKKRRH